MRFPGRRAPVITISCPSCGGQVRGAREGQHTACQYCRTELFVPQIGIAPPPHERHVPQAIVRREQQGSSAGSIVLLLAVLILLGGVGATVWILYQVVDPVDTATAPSEPPPVVVPQPAVTATTGQTRAGQGGGMKKANCLMGCLSKCGDPNDNQMAYATCAQGCATSCE